VSFAPCPLLDLAVPGDRERLDALRRALESQADLVSEAGRRRTIEVFGEPLSPRDVVARICSAVRDRGADAVREYSARLDGVGTDAPLFVSSATLAAAHEAVEPGFLRAIRRIRDRVECFQRALLPRDAALPLPGGGLLRQRFLPLDRVGVCVPGGAAAYPSTLLMTVVPARVAGVPEIVVVAPPTPFGADNVHVLATCHELGVDRVVRAGGAQAVAALAYGIDGLPRVDKIVGPGNLFVALAKRFVAGDVAIDAIAGPSEIVIVADESAHAEYIAADMLAQAEHSPGSALLFTASRALAEATAAALDRQLTRLERESLTRDSLARYGAIVVCRDMAEAVTLADRLAPEHLSIDTADAEATLAGIRHAGAAFLGPYSPVAAGDYAAGPSHVLPTGGTARFTAGLSAQEFVRGGSVIRLSQADLDDIAGDICILADTEGLTAHRRSVEIRRP